MKGIKTDMNDETIFEILNRNSLVPKIDYDFFDHKRILITGAGGTIGSSVLKTIDQQQPESVLAIDFNEECLQSVKRRITNKNIHMILGDIKNSKLIEKCSKDIDIVIHCAAFKHIDLVETNVEESFLNNLQASINLVNICFPNGVKYFVNTSTDKSVNFNCLMGAMKKILEEYIDLSNRYTDGHYYSSRFGNIFGSRGSVFHVFKEQLLNKQPITLTDEKMERYFISQNESCYYLLYPMGKYEDLSVFTMNIDQQYKITEIIKNIAEFYGISDYQIDVVGLRPGEKLNESLISEDETIELKEKEIIGIKMNNRKTIEEINDFSNIISKRIYKSNNIKDEIFEFARR